MCAYPNLIDILELIPIVAVLFLWSYISAKGKNLATKEDIRSITKEVEEVRHEYATRMEHLHQQNQHILEQGSRRHQLRMSALDQRLKVHQEAFALWRKLVNSFNNRQEMNAMAIECQEWFYNNCLYLDEESRQAFYNAYITAPDYIKLRDSHAKWEDIKQAWQRVMNAGTLIQKGVELPPIKLDDSEFPSPPGQSDSSDSSS